MPPRSSIYQLSDEHRAELDRRLIESGFGGYSDLTDWLQSNGYQISRSALHRYGSELEQDFETTMAEVQRTQRLAVAFADANPDERGAMVGATARIASESLLRITMALRQSEEDPAELAHLMPKISRALSELGRLTISQEQWAKELKAEAAKQAAAELAARAEAASGGPQGAITPERLREIAREVYGV